MPPVVVTGYTAEHMQEIEDETIVGAHIVANLLVLDRKDGDTIDVGLLEPGVTFNRVISSYGLLISDVNKCIEMDDSSPNDLVVPDNVSVPFPIGTIIKVIQRGTGLTTIDAGIGVTLNSLGGLLDSAGQYSKITLEKVDDNEWYVSGDLA